MVLWIGVGAALLVLAAAVVWHGLREAPPQPLVQSILMPPATWNFDSASPFAVSPDGRRIAFVANANHENGANPGETSSIWLRDLSEAESFRLAGTDGACYPFNDDFCGAQRPPGADKPRVSGATMRWREIRLGTARR